MAKRNFYSQTEINEFHRIVKSLIKDALTELVGDESGTTNRVVCPFSKIKGLSTNPSAGSIFQRLFHSNLFIRHLDHRRVHITKHWKRLVVLHIF
jgi:hypothetical protein